MADSSSTGGPASRPNEGASAAPKSNRHRRPRGRKPANGGDKKDAGGNSKDNESKPVPNNKGVQNPQNRRRRVPLVRDGQITQVLKRYSGRKETDTVFSLRIKPSDPEFAFDLDTLLVDLNVPDDYPATIPWIKVKNEDIPRGYAINVERGFYGVANAKRKTSLANLIQDLDKNLESYLKQEKQETIKIVKFKGSSKQASPPPPPSRAEASGAVSSSTVSSAGSSVPTSSTDARFKFDPKRKPLFVPKEVKDRREAEMSIMRQRLKDDVTLYSDQSDAVFTVRISPQGSELLPEEYQGSVQVRLTVPKDYNLSPCHIKFVNSGPGSETVEKNFNSHAASHMRGWTLVSHLNFLSEKFMSLLLDDTVDHRILDQNAGTSTTEKTEYNVETAESYVSDKAKSKQPADDHDGAPSLDEDSTDHDSSAAPSTASDSDSDSDSEYEGEGTPSLKLREQGTAIEFPQLEMSNIGYLEVHGLHLVVKCERCKTFNEVANIVSGPFGRESKLHSLRCEKCDHVMGIGFRKNLLFSTNHNAGYLDLVGCSAVDILPSSYTPTCGPCSESSAVPFRKVELGRIVTQNCRNCHAKMSLLIPDFRLDVLSTGDVSRERVGPAKSKKKSEKLGLVGGTPLPNNGSCAHYKKSQRWFRFSCCGRVFPCDKCHDAAMDHTEERANRMICGKCSREQNFSNVCVFCRQSFEHRFSPFWEGGKGTRDKTRMSRKDPRKYKRVPK